MKSIYTVLVLLVILKGVESTEESFLLMNWEKELLVPPGNVS